MQLGVFHQPQAEAFWARHQIRNFDSLCQSRHTHPLKQGGQFIYPCSPGSSREVHLRAFPAFFGTSRPDSLTQVWQWRREAALGKAGKLSRPSQRYLLSGICWRSSMTATNLRYFWMLQRKTDYIKRNSTFESANMK